MNGGPLDAAGQVFCGYAGDGLLAGGVDGQHDDGIGIAECATELVHEIESAGIPVGLEDDVDSAVAALAGGGEGGANLGGMVAVVVDDGDAARRAAKLKAPVDAAKVAEALGNLIRRELRAGGRWQRRPWR